MPDSFPDLHFPDEHQFPVDFPYEFSLVDSTESSDEDDFLVGLTPPRPMTQQQLAVDPKKMITSGSPKSTLCGIGSWSMSSNSTTGEVSPPTTPPGTKSEPTYAGADQRFIGGATTPAPAYHGGRYVRPLGLPQSAWPPLQLQQNKYRSPANGVLNGSGVKRSCAGTGVFLPRRFDDSVKKSDCSTVLVPAKIVGNQSINGAFASKQDHASMATRNGLLAQNKVILPTNFPTESAVKYELCLPQEWIY
ncbi:hypothetical protein M5689_002009 [Euphorbia peplus]|nr:hypothetical protein M5689_002009 [Euphorbia peplus]